VSGGAVHKIEVLTIPTPIGEVHLAATDAGLASVSMGDGPRIAGLDGVVDIGGETVERAASQLDEYFRGDRSTFAVDLDWQLVAGFRRAVLQALVSVPYGETVSYGELAGMVGNPGAVRAVGSAMAHNPLAIVVPCHRVLASGGRPGGYSAPGGLRTKQQLLALEGVELCIPAKT